LEFYHSLLQPLIDVYAVSALGLQRLVGRQVTEQDYLQELLQEMRTELKLGFAHYGETSHFESSKQNVTAVINCVVLESQQYRRSSTFVQPALSNIINSRPFFVFCAEFGLKSTTDEQTF